MGRYSPRNQRGSTLPAWLVFLIGVALVFGAFYLLQGVQTFFRTGGLGVEESTRQAEIITSATQARATRVIAQFTAMPTASPLPTCSDFRVSVPSAIVRDAPTSTGAVVTGFVQGDIVCVLWREPGSEWYAIDRDTSTRRREIAYMHQSVIVPVNPTPSAPPSATPPPTQPPTVTPRSQATRAPRTNAPTASPLVAPTASAPPVNAAPTLPPPPPTVTPTDGIPMQSA